MKRILTILALTVCLLLGISGAALAQAESDSTEEDPFKNDPFFSAPISDFFKRPADQDTSRINTRRLVRSLNEEGLDF